MGLRGKSWVAWLVPLGFLAGLVLCLTLPVGRHRNPAPPPMGQQVVAFAGRAQARADEVSPETALAPDRNLPPTTPAWSAPGRDLVGRIISTNGEPVAGAMVLIDRAAPRVGRGYT